MAAAAARGVNDVSRAHVGSLGTRPRRRKWVRRCLASTLAQDGVGVDLLWLAEDLRGLHVFRDTPRRCVPEIWQADAQRPSTKSGIAGGACVCSLWRNSLSNFIANHLSENAIDTTQVRNTSAREDESGSLEYQALNARTSRANAPLARTRLSRGSPRVGTTLLLIRGTMLSEAGLLPLEAGATPRSAPRGQRRGGFEGPES